MNNHIIEGLNGKRIIDFNSVANNVPKDETFTSLMTEQMKLLGEGGSVSEAQVDDVLSAMRLTGASENFLSGLRANINAHMTVTAGGDKTSGYQRGPGASGVRSKEPILSYGTVKFYDYDLFADLNPTSEPSASSSSGGG